MNPVLLVALAFVVFCAGILVGGALVAQLLLSLQKAVWRDAKAAVNAAWAEREQKAKEVEA